METLINKGTESLRISTALARTGASSRRHARPRSTITSQQYDNCFASVVDMQQQGAEPGTASAEALNVSSMFHAYSQDQIA